MNNYKSMFEQAVRTLAEIDRALGIGDDGCGDPEQTLFAIDELKASGREEGYREGVRDAAKRAKDWQCNMNADYHNCDCEAAISRLLP